MVVVNIQDVNISNIPDVQNPDRQIAVLTYLGCQYESIQTFSLTQLHTAQALARHFDDQGTRCAIVKSSQNYSVWVERKPTIASNNSPASVTSDNSPNTQAEDVFRAQLYLIDGLWSEIREILGTARATSFGDEILASIPTIRSTTYLSATIFMAKQLAKSIDVSIPTTRQLIDLYRSIQTLGGKYLGKNYAIELLNDLQQGLPVRLKQTLQSWLQQNLG
jgi:hypothetical protein